MNGGGAMSAVDGDAAARENLVHVPVLLAEVVELFSGSLGEDGSGAETYLAYVRTNAERISGALS